MIDMVKIVVYDWEHEGKLDSVWGGVYWLTHWMEGWIEREEEVDNSTRW